MEKWIMAYFHATFRGGQLDGQEEKWERAPQEGERVTRQLSCNSPVQYRWDNAAHGFVPCPWLVTLLPNPYFLRR